MALQLAASWACKPAGWLSKALCNRPQMAQALLQNQCIKKMSAIVVMGHVSCESLVRKYLVLLIALVTLIATTKTVSADPISLPPIGPEVTFDIFILAVFSIFIFNYLVSLGSAALVMKVFGYEVDKGSVNKLAGIMFKVVVLGTIVVFLISGTFGTGIYWLSLYGISAVLVGLAEIILMSLFLHGIYATIPLRRAASISACAIIFGALIGFPFVFYFLRF
jgi:hypothetical protein